MAFDPLGVATHREETMGTVSKNRKHRLREDTADRKLRAPTLSRLGCDGGGGPAHEPRRAAASEGPRCRRAPPVDCLAGRVNAESSSIIVVFVWSHQLKHGI